MRCTEMMIATSASPIAAVLRRAISWWARVPLGRYSHDRLGRAFLLVALVASVLIAGLHRSSHASSVQYSVLDLGTLGGSQSQPAAINALGQVAGYSNLQGDGVIHAFLFDGTQLRDLGTLGGPDSVAYGINAYGTVVGYAQNLS